MTTFGHTIEDDPRHIYGYEKANEKITEKITEKSLKKNVKINIFLSKMHSLGCNLILKPSLT